MKKVTNLSHQHQLSLPLTPKAEPIVGMAWQSAVSPFKLRSMKVRQLGFSLIELLITVAIAAILLSLAAPNFREMLVKRSVQAAAETLASDMRYARSEALKRVTQTVMCQSADGIKCSNVLLDWSQGWIVYIEANPAAQVAVNTAVPTRDLVRVQQQLPNIASIPSVDWKVRFEPTGWAKNANDSLVITPTGSVPVGSTRLLCMSSTGRPALRVPGTSVC